MKSRWDTSGSRGRQCTRRRWPTDRCPAARRLRASSRCLEEALEEVTAASTTTAVQLDEKEEPVAAAAAVEDEARMWAVAAAEEEARVLLEQEAARESEEAGAAARNRQEQETKPPRGRRTKDTRMHATHMPIHARHNNLMHIWTLWQLAWWR